MIDIDSDVNILRTYMLFAQTAQAALKYADAHLYREAGLSIVKLVALKALASNNGIMKPSEMANWTYTERHNMTTLVERMRRDGLVITERDTGDKRVVKVILTHKGRECLSRAMVAATEIVSQVMSSITEADAALLEKSLRVIRQNACHGLESIAKPRFPLPELENSVAPPTSKQSA